MFATTIAHPSLRTASNRRPRPSDPDWSLSVARAYARAAQEAYALAGELSRRSETLLRAAPKLRAKKGGARGRFIAVGRLRFGVAGGESGRPVRSRIASLVRSTDGTRRRARTLRAREFSAVWTVAFSSKARTDLREQNRKKCDEGNAVMRSMKAARADIDAQHERRARSSRRSSGQGGDLFDADLFDLPQAMRWREWMGRVEAAIFASPSPVTREALVKLVGRDCNFDELISDIREDLRARPYELVHVAGGYQLRTKARYADAIRVLNNGARDAGPPELTPTELLTVTAIAYLQPATRAELSRLAGREISRDVIGALKRHGLIDGALRAPEPGAPYAYVTTKKFLEAFGLASLRELPDIEKLEDAGWLERSANYAEIDDVVGLWEGSTQFTDEGDED